MARNRWEKFGKKNAEYYILTYDIDYTAAEGMEQFFESGRREVEVILREVGDRVPTNGTALEIGCGVGRLALPMAERFDRVIGVDIAPSMLEKLAKNAEDASLHNIVGFLADAPWEKEGPIDFSSTAVSSSSTSRIKPRSTRISCASHRACAAAASPISSSTLARRPFHTT